MDAHVLIFLTLINTRIIIVALFRKFLNKTSTLHYREVLAAFNIHCDIQHARREPIRIRIVGIIDAWNLETLILLVF